MSRDNFSENLGDLLEKEKQEVAFFVELQKKKKKKKLMGYQYRRTRMHLISR